MTTSISAKAPPEASDESDEEDEPPFTPRLSPENPAAVRVSRTHSVSDPERIAFPLFVGLDTGNSAEEEETVRKESEACARLSPAFPAEVQVTRNIEVEWIDDLDFSTGRREENESWSDEEHSFDSWPEEERREARREEKHWDRWH